MQQQGLLGGEGLGGRTGPNTRSSATGQLAQQLWNGLCILSSLQHWGCHDAREHHELSSWHWGAEGADAGRASRHKLQSEQELSATH